MREKVLRLRDDPALSAMMAAEFSMKDRERLMRVLGREPRKTDLYMCHLLGITSAVRFLEALDTRPGTSSAAVVPRAVKGNPGLFVVNGKTLSVNDAYRSIQTSLRERLTRYGELVRVSAGVVDERRQPVSFAKTVPQAIR